LPRPYLLAILPNGVLRRCQDRLHNHPKVSCTFGPDVCCAGALVQESRPGFPGVRPKYQWLISLNRSATKTKSMFPACRVIYSGALARRCRRCKIRVDHFSLATAGQLASSATGPQLGCWRRLRRRPRLSYCHDRIRAPHSKPLCTCVSPFDVSLQESVTSELNYLVARGRQACPMVCAPPPTLSVSHAFPHLALSAPPAAHLHGCSLLSHSSLATLLCRVQLSAASRGQGRPRPCAGWIGVSAADSDGSGVMRGRYMVWDGLKYPCWLRPYGGLITAYVFTCWVACELRPFY